MLVLEAGQIKYTQIPIKCHFINVITYNCERNKNIRNQFTNKFGKVLKFPSFSYFSFFFGNGCFLLFLFSTSLLLAFDSVFQSFIVVIVCVIRPPFMKEKKLWRKKMFKVNGWEADHARKKRKFFYIQIFLGCSFDFCLHLRKIKWQSGFLHF